MLSIRDKRHRDKGVDHKGVYSIIAAYEIRIIRGATYQDKRSALLNRIAHFREKAVRNDVPHHSSQG